MRLSGSKQPAGRLKQIDAIKNDKTQDPMALLLLLLLFYPNGIRNRCWDSRRNLGHGHRRHALRCRALVSGIPVSARPCRLDDVAVHHARRCRSKQELDGHDAQEGAQQFLPLLP